MDNKAILQNRKNRVIATILGYKETEIDQFLPPEMQVALRKKILDQVNDLTNLALDLITPESVMLNEVYLEKIDQMYERLGDLDDGG